MRKSSSDTTPELLSLNILYQYAVGYNRPIKICLINLEYDENVHHYLICLGIYLFTDQSNNTATSMYNSDFRVP